MVVAFRKRTVDKWDTLGNSRLTIDDGGDTPMTDIKSWLAEHGFERFTDVFVENEIDLEALSELTDEHLKELGPPLGPLSAFHRFACSTMRSFKAPGRVERFRRRRRRSGEPRSAPGRHEVHLEQCD